mgnify:CR=1 FL=1
MKTNKLLGGTMLITSTTIGAAMVALPVSAAGISFAPSALLLCACWVLMLYSAFLILEVNLWFDSGVNMVTMAKNTLGNTGQYVAWTAYLLLLYSLMAAYLSGMGGIIEGTHMLIGQEVLPPWLGISILLGLFGFIIYLGTRTVDYLNRFFITCLFIAYIVLVANIAPHIDKNNLNHLYFNHFLYAIPIMITAFGYHIVIPSVRNYLNNDTDKVISAIGIGSIIPILMYLGWIFIILGAVPDTQLTAIWFKGQPAIDLPRTLDALLDDNVISAGATVFTFFAIATSFIGVSLSLFDFLCDGLHIAKTKLGRIATAGLTFLPPMIFNIFHPNAFLVTLGYASIFVAVLLGLLPIAMVWHGRYYQSLKGSYTAPGGKGTLLLAGVCFIGVIVLEIMPH